MSPIGESLHPLLRLNKLRLPGAFDDDGSLLAPSRVVVFHGRDVRSDVLDVLLMLRRCPDALCRLKLVVDDRVLLGPQTSGGSDLM
ncbi:hypothetical protein [Halarchaeum acidiphilum]|uniref:hypothetical protein n=1 Tax=Halarchaeum acidiphilum TaxID=489138 RepID=UPI00036785D0|nr:hypothetical protein [Halarchaeum acidiphilum]